MARVDLRKLKPNPKRNFKIDPIDPEAVEALRRSIDEHGFWGGVVCRKRADGTVEIAAGHHRVDAAVKAGLTIVDLTTFPERELDDNQMGRLYAAENATQRGASGTAFDGSVAAAIDCVARMLLAGEDVSRILETSDRGLETLRGQLASDKGLGADVVVAFLHDTPGITTYTVQKSLARLKASGDYAEIMRKVHEDLERERAEAIVAAAEAEKAHRREEAERKRAEAERKRAEANGAAEAKQAASRQPVTFDSRGVRRSLKNDHQLTVFQELVTGPGIAEYVAVDKQAELAEWLGGRFAAYKDEERKKGTRVRDMSADWIRANIQGAVLDFRSREREIKKAERERAERASRQSRLHAACEQFSTAMGRAQAAGLRIAAIVKDWPKGEPIVWPGEFHDDLVRTRDIINKMLKGI